MKGAFFHVYYHTRCYFDETAEKCEVKQVGSYEVVADIYTMCHVMTRHYYPLMNNRGIGGSLNEDIGCIDIANIPQSVLELVEKFSRVCPLTVSTEYLLFLIEGEHYILWLRFDGGKFYIRSFYKCEMDYDLKKYEGKNEVVIESGLSAVI